MSTCSRVGSDTCLSNSATRRISARDRPAAVDLDDRPDDFVEGTAMVFLNHPSTRGLRELRPVRSNHCIRSYVSLEVMIGLSVYLVKPFWLFHAIDFQRKGPSRNADASAPWPVRRPTPEIETKHFQLARFRSSQQRCGSSLLPPGGSCSS